MAEENISQEFRFKNIHETRNCLTEEINRNELMSTKHKKVYKTLNYIKHFLILGSTITGCISISAFASLIDILIWIMGSAIGLKIWPITVAIIKYSLEVLISKALIDSVISHDVFVLKNNVLKEYNKMKEEIKNQFQSVYRKF